MKYAVAATALLAGLPAYAQDMVFTSWGGTTQNARTEWQVNKAIPMELARDLLPWRCPVGRFKDAFDVTHAYPKLAA